MKDKMRKILLGNINFPLLLLAVVASILLWLVVVNVDDPTRTKTFTTTVTVKNENVLTKAGKYYTLKTDDKVTFRVTAKRSVIEKISGSDFTAVADMNNLEDDSRIPVYITADKYASKITISSKTYYLDVRVGEINENEFDIVCESSGELPEGYGVRAVTAEPTSVVITGPDDIVKKIARVKAVVDVTGLTEDTEKQVSLQPYDKKGNLIDTSKLDFSQKKAKVKVEIGMVKSIEIKVDATGKLADGYSLTSVTTNPTTVRVIGTAATLNTLTAVTIPSSVLNLADATDSVTTTVSVNSYLPSGVTVVNGDDATITIVASIKKTQTTSTSQSGQSTQSRQTDDADSTSTNKNDNN